MSPIVSLTPYHAESTMSDGTIDYIYYLNVCGPVKGGGCEDDTGFISSCQVKAHGNSKIAGRYQNQTLRYLWFEMVLYTICMFW